LKNFDRIWLENIDLEVLNFLDNLKKSNKYNYKPSLKGVTEQGNNIKLGFSCYALKILYILDNNSTEDLTTKHWTEYLNSFQKKFKNFPQNSYIDEEFLKYSNQFNVNRLFKDLIKKTIHVTGLKNYQTSQEKLVDFIKAESKQAISTIYQVNGVNGLPYLDFPKNEESIKKYLNSLNWSYPWNAGAQYSSLCLFSSTQIDNDLKKEEIKKDLNKYSDDLVNYETGLYHKGTQTNRYELINGAMKVLSGFSWINKEIHYPEKLIDFCLDTEFKNEGCDLVDIVYVLYRCHEESNYRTKDIVNYFNKLLPAIKLHYYSELGGFSYFIRKSQTHYYGVKITNGEDTPDIHGTLLLTWAISMILKIIEFDSLKLKILKP
tara:strand:- start:3636 stop:4763 length:1128 start_codon:yes stop_codon:yes gene_type:complete